MNTNRIIKVIIPQQVRVRKYKVDVDRLSLLLKSKKSERNLSNKQISEILNQPKTLVDHWFRTDKSFSIPSEDIWYELKKLLQIDTNEFDKSITEFEIRDGVFEQANRVYDTEGIAPTLTCTNAETERYLVRDNITFVEKKYDEFYAKNGYIPKMFNPYNTVEITDVAPIVTTNCGATTSSSTVLVANNNDLGGNGLNDLNQVGYIKNNKQGNRVYDAECSPTIQATGGGLSGNSGFHVVQPNDACETEERSLEKLENANSLRIFEAFAGIGAMHRSLELLGVPLEVTGISEVDVDAIISYAATHQIPFEHIETPDKETMIQELESKRIGYDFKKEKSCIRGLRNEKLIKVYQAHKAIKCYGDVSLINPNDLPDFDMFNVSSPCFVEGTLVLTDKGYKAIEDIASNDYVLTHTNQYQKVITPMTNFANHIYRLKTMCSEDLLVTEEHPFYIRERYKVWDNKNRVYLRKFKDPRWITTKDLTKDCYVGVAINQKSQLPTWDGCEVNAPYASRGNKKILNSLSQYFNNNDFWWIVGRYIGDGWIVNKIDCKGTDIYNLFICCAKDEVNEIVPVLDRLGKQHFHYNVIEERTVIKIRISNVEFAKFLQQFGKGAKGKHLNESVLDLPVHLLESFLEGYWSADGCYTNNMYKCCSVSRKLIYGIGECVAKVYQRPYSIYRQEPRSREHKIEGRIINSNTSYNLTFKKKQNKQDKAFYDNGYVWCPVNSVKQEEYHGTVYNMEVESDNSYTVNNIIVHNCTDFSIAGEQKGIEDEDGKITRSGMYIFGVDILAAKRPKYILFENVKNLVSKKFVHIFHKIVSEIDAAGYNCYYPKNAKGNPSHINAKNFGIPQNRERVFIIGIRKDIDNGQYEFPKGFDSGLRLKDILEPQVDEKYYLSEEIQNRFKQKYPDNGTHNIIGSTSPPTRTIGQRDNVYGKNSVMGALVASDYKQPKQVLDNTDEIITVGNTNDSNHNATRVLDPDGVSCTVMHNNGKVVQIIEPNEIDRIGGLYDTPKRLSQTAVLYGTGGISPTLDTMQGGYRQPMVKDIQVVGHLECKGWMDNEKRVHSFDGIAPCLETRNRAKYIEPIEDKELVTVEDGEVRVKQGTKQGYDVAEVGDSINVAFPTSLTRRGRVGKGVSQTITCANTMATIEQTPTNNYRIRKLTPIECWRLMGFTKYDCLRARSKGISDSQLYKQAGNSIVVDCLYYMFKNLFIAMNEFKEVENAPQVIASQVVAPKEEIITPKEIATHQEISNSLYTSYFSKLKEVCGKYPTAKKILITRYNKIDTTEYENLEWLPTVAPSRELLESYKDEDITFNQFKKAYLEQITKDSKAKEYIKYILNLINNDSVILFCYEKDSNMCHRSILAKLISMISKKDLYKGEITLDK